VTPQTELRIKGEGMPSIESGDIVIDTKKFLISKHHQQRGDLVIKFNITFPQKILTHHREAMLKALALNQPFKA
jgi:DnaJ-class molecular chaperone